MNSERITVNGGNKVRPVHRLLFTVHAFLCTATSSVVAQIQDNSFLLEEAYNQESGVVQHISAFQRSSGGDWAYAFTQEWPLGGISHQLSYTIPVLRVEGFGTGLGDVALNYRHQLLGDPAAQTVVAPRVSLLLPTGNEEEGRGAGGLGFQANIPVTLVLGSAIVTHWNTGATVTPSARDSNGNGGTTLSFNLGGSMVWLFRPSMNFLVEALWLSEELVLGGRENTGLISPGIRWAFDRGDLQIVPGVAYTIGLGPDQSDDALFIYLSFEHPFKR